MKTAIPTTSAPIFLNNRIAAAAVPPVAITSSTSKTFSLVGRHRCGSRESRCRIRGSNPHGPSRRAAFQVSEPV